jgi:hypothetical protein
MYFHRMTDDELKNYASLHAETPLEKELIARLVDFVPEDDLSEALCAQDCAEEEARELREKLEAAKGVAIKLFAALNSLDSAYLPPAVEKALEELEEVL